MEINQFNPIHVIVTTSKGKKINQKEVDKNQFDQLMRENRVIKFCQEGFKEWVSVRPIPKIK